MIPIALRKHLSIFYSSPSSSSSDEARLMCCKPTTRAEAKSRAAVYHRRCNCREHRSPALLLNELFFHVTEDLARVSCRVHDQICKVTVSAVTYIRYMLGTGHSGWKKRLKLLNIEPEQSTKHPSATKFMLKRYCRREILFNNLMVFSCP